MLYLDGHSHLIHQLWVLMLRGMLSVLLPLSVVVAVEHLRHVLGYAWVKYRVKQGKRPVDAFPKRLLSQDAHDSKAWPRVAIQLPMFNERLVCQALIDCACQMDWPSTRLCVQVLDDSTDWTTRQLVDDKVAEWRERGVLVEAVRRTHRQGYKAGALKQGMDMLHGYDYIAVFDADFRPEPDFLLKTVPYLEGSPNTAFVQARWMFSNAEESYLTKCQELSLNYHFKVEQYVHFAHGSFFNFNGTAGVWRAKAVANVGGWYSRTTVEDMDLSLRTYLAGWRAVFLEDVGVMSEVPSSLYAFRKQQHRWTTGPMQLLTKVFPEVLRSPIPFMRKLELVTCYFGIGKMLTHIVCLLFYCVLLPLSVFTPEVQQLIPIWSLLHVPVIVTLDTCVFTTKGWQYAVTFVLFQNAMGVVKLWAIIAGVLGLRHANEWVVTTKLGSGKKGAKVEMEVPSCRIYPAELALGAFTLLAAAVGTYQGMHFGINVYLFFQGFTFVAFGLNLVDSGNSLGCPLTPSEKHLLSKTIKINAISCQLPATPYLEAKT